MRPTTFFPKNEPERHIEERNEIRNPMEQQLPQALVPERDTEEEKREPFVDEKQQICSSAL